MTVPFRLHPFRSMRGRISPAFLLAALVLAASPASAKEGGTPGAAPPEKPPPGGALPGGPPRTNPERSPAPREVLWAAATEEEWKRPCLVRFQRTWEDAVAVARETGKPILICVNMDGEIASEHYAGVRYRQPETAALYEPYVCVIATVYRHTPRDYDDAGNRILCPRFGSVTCGEHISIEPVLYERFFDGKRIAPRHLMVEPDGREVFDVFYANDTASVFRTIVDGVEGRPVTATVVRGDRPVVERVASRDASDRGAVESAYRQGDAATRRSLLEAAAAHPEAAPLDLLRLAVFGLDGDLGALARKALARMEAPAATGLLSDALRAPLPPEERDALIAALARLGDRVPRARWLSVVHRGLSGPSTALDVRAWAGATYEAPGAEAAATGVPAPRTGDAESPEAKAASRLESAEASLAQAMAGTGFEHGGEKSRRLLTGLLHEEARKAALEAEALGARGWRTDAVVALASYFLGHREDAYARAEAAVKALPPGESSPNSAAVITVFGEGRWMAMKQAVRAKKEWPSAWLTDLNAAYSVLRRHPLGTDAQVVWHYDLLLWLGAVGQGARVLEEGVARFTESEALHERYRARLLEDRGPAGLEAAYEGQLRGKGADPGLAAFAARASVAAAESLRRARRPAEALASYERSAGLFERALAADPRRRDEVDRAMALVHGARARLSFQAGDDGKALEEIVASLERDPGAAADLDGLGFSPVETARLILARLRAGRDPGPAARLEEALGKIDPDRARPDR